MTIEAGAVISTHGEVIFWHLPAGRSVGSIPDTRILWDVLWDNRECLAGFAHSHPGAGVPGPSRTDVTTFLAIEMALGRRLQWWIASEDTLVSCMRYGGISPIYSRIIVSKEPSWASELRAESRPVFKPLLSTSTGSSS